MDTTTEEKLPPQNSRMVQGMARIAGTVPACALSPSNEGLAEMLSTGASVENASVVEQQEVASVVAVATVEAVMAATSEAKVSSNGTGGEFKVPTSNEILEMKPNVSHSLPTESSGNRGKDNVEEDMEVDETGVSRKRKRDTLETEEEEDRPIPSGSKLKGGRPKIQEEEGSQSGSRMDGEQAGSFPKQKRSSTENNKIINVDKYVPTNAVEEDLVDVSKGIEILGKGKKRKVVRRKLVEETTGQNIKKGRRRTKNLSISLEDMVNLEGEEEEYQEERLERMAASEIGSIGLKRLKQLNELRSKSSNIKGTIHSCMKKRIEEATGVIKVLMNKLQTTGDIKLQMIKNVELEEEIKAFKKERIEKDRKIDVLHEVISGLKKNLDRVELRLKVLEREKDIKSMTSQTRNPDQGCETYSKQEYIQEDYKLKANPIVQVEDIYKGNRKEEKYKIDKKKDMYKRNNARIQTN